MKRRDFITLLGGAAAAASFFFVCGRTMFSRHQGIINGIPGKRS
jgi:hypothetical protein